MPYSVDARKKSSVTVNDTDYTQQNDVDYRDRSITVGQGGLAVGEGGSYAPNQSKTDIREDNRQDNRVFVDSRQDNRVWEDRSQTESVNGVSAKGGSVINISEVNPEVAAEMNRTYESFVAGNNAAIDKSVGLSSEAVNAMAYANAKNTELAETAIINGSEIGRELLYSQERTHGANLDFADGVLQRGADQNTDVLNAGVYLNEEFLRSTENADIRNKDFTYGVYQDGLSFADAARRDALDFGENSMLMANNAFQDALYSAERSAEGALNFGNNAMLLSDQARLDALGFQNSALGANMDLAYNASELAYRSAQDNKFNLLETLTNALGFLDKQSEDMNHIIRDNNELFATGLADKTNDASTAVAEKAMEKAVIVAGIVGISVVALQYFRTKSK